MKKILLVFGTRPEAVKLCPLVRELKKRKGLQTLVCLSGQHREMLRQAMDAFQVTADYDLDLMRPEQSLFDITTAVLQGLRPVLEAEKPDLVLVQGDTTTAFAAALACFYLQIPLGHVEAGLRSGDMARPFPEEFNRQALGLLSRWHFAPTPQAATELLREGKAPESVFVTGNTVIDALGYTLRPDYRHPALDWAGEGRLLLLTLHRRESLGAPMAGMLRAVRRALEEHPDCRLLFPVHRNPAVGAVARRELGDCPQAMLTDPLDVTDWHNLEARCHLCLTDSGGVQEECPSLGKPVLVLRDATERPEGVAAGTARLAGTGEEEVYRALTELLDRPELYRAMARAVSPYGDGHASERIADVLERGSCRPWEGEKAPGY